MKSLDQKKISRIKDKLDRPLVVIGLMGAGKTRIGRALAEVLDLPFADSDDEIVKAAQLSIAEIFERYGESYFRDGERRVLARLIRQKPCGVISTGGGAVMTEKTAELIWAKTLSIWIRADLDIMVERVGRTDKRPLLRGKDAGEVLRDLAARRYSVYEKADIVIESHNGPIEAIIYQALDKIEDCLDRKAGSSCGEGNHG